MSILLDSEEISPEQISQGWFIDLGWYQRNNRSFFTLAGNCLCPKCHGRLGVGKGEIPAVELLSAIKDRCSSQPGFITGNLPIMESVFRRLLANGNQPLDLAELSRQLSEWRGGDTYHTSVEVLTRLLARDQYYGLRLV